MFGDEHMDDATVFSPNTGLPGRTGQVGERGEAGRPGIPGAKGDLGDKGNHLFVNKVAFIQTNG